MTRTLSLVAHGVGDKVMIDRDPTERQRYENIVNFMKVENDARVPENTYALLEEGTLGGRLSVFTSDGELLDEIRGIDVQAVHEIYVETRMVLR